MSSVKENKEEQIRLEVRRFFSETLMSLYASEGVPEHERTPRRQKEVVMKSECKLLLWLNLKELCHR